NLTRTSSADTHLMNSAATAAEVVHCASASNHPALAGASPSSTYRSALTGSPPPTPTPTPTPRGGVSRPVHAANHRSGSGWAGPAPGAVRRLRRDERNRARMGSLDHRLDVCQIRHVDRGQRSAGTREHARSALVDPSQDCAPQHDDDLRRGI